MVRLKHWIIKKSPKYILLRIRALREAKDYISALTYIIFGGGDKNLSYAAKYFLRYSDCQKKKSKSPAFQWGTAFAYYRSFHSNNNKIYLSWSDTPAPGNYGDWLSPYILQKFVNLPIKHVNLMSRANYPHYVGLGSIISRANSYSRVIGAGITHLNDDIDTRAQFLCVRGPYTAERIKKIGGPSIEVFGDPGFLLPKIYHPITPRTKTTEVLLVRHLNHRNIPLQIFDSVREYPIQAAHPVDIENFVDTILNSKLVVTSAMHCFITCIAYGVPCVLFKPEFDPTPVPGDGIKYRDALSGAGLPETTPVKIKLDKDFLLRVQDVPPYTAMPKDSALAKLLTLYTSITHIK